MYRRTILSGLAAVPAFSMTGSAKSGPGGFLNHQELAQRKVQELQKSLQKLPDDPEAGVVRLAQDIATAYREAKAMTTDLVPGASHIFDIENLNQDASMTIKYFRPLYKFLDVLDGTYDVKFPNYTLYRAMRVGATLTSIGGLLIALKNLGEISERISDIVAEQSVAAVPDGQFKEFYFASFLLMAETILFVYPVSFRFAWTGTRLVTNRLLFHLRRLPFGNEILALVMSSVHWVLRDVPMAAVHNVEDINPIIEFIYDELTQRASELRGEVDYREIQTVSKCDVKDMVAAMLEEYFETDINLDAIPC